MKKIISIFSLVFFGLYFSAMTEVVRPGETNIMCTVDVLGATSASDGPVTKIKALWCPEPTTPEHATTCVLNAAVPGTCSYTTKCELGYQPTGADRVDGQNGYKSIHPENYESTALCPSCEAKQINCSAGYYLPEGSETCAACPAGYYCPGSSNAGFTNGYTYTGAEQGKFACPAGSHSVSSSASSTNTKCELCTAGTTSDDGAGTCSITCSNNTTGAVKNWVEPNFNPTTPDWTGNSTPTVNNICTIDNCNSGYGFETNKCTACTAGNYCRGDKNPSKVCPIGSYSGAKASTCTKCANNETTDHEGSTTINDCQLCSNSTGASTWADNSFDSTTGTMSNVCSVTSCKATYAYDAGTGASPLPDGYTQLEYIKSTGTQYIDTGETGTYMTGVDIEFQLSTLTYTNFVGITGSASGSTPYGAILGLGSGSKFYSQVGGNGSYVYMQSIDLNKHNFTYRSNGTTASLSLDGTSYQYSHSSSSSDFSHVTIFKRSPSSAVGVAMKLYSYKLYDGDTLIKNLIPAKQGNTIGMYDTVSGNFFPNAGTGTFTAGPAVGVGGHNFLEESTCDIINVGTVVSGRAGWVIDLPAGTYTVSSGTTASSYVRTSTDGGETWSNYTTVKNTTPYTFTEATDFKVVVYGPGSIDVPTFVGRENQLEIGSTVTPYVPYGGGATAGGTCTACTAGNYCPGGTESAHICPVGSYSGDLQSVCTLCTKGTTTTNAGSTSSSQCDTCPNATGVSTSGWQTPTFNSDNSFVNNKCSVSSCNAGYAYISTANTAGYIEIAPSDTTTYHVELTGWKAFTLNGSETWSTQAHFTGTYDVAMSETATDSPVRIYNENYTTAATLPTTTAGKVIQGGGYIGFGTTIEYSRSSWTNYLNAHPHTVLAQLATSDASKWRAVKRVSDGAYGYYCTEGAQTGTFVGAKGMTGTTTSTTYTTTQSSDYQNACSMCPAGQSCTGGTTQGTECADGKYAQAGASSCTDCVMGAYTSSTTGHAKCTACTDGTTTNGAGGASCNVRCSNYNDFATWATPTWTVTISTNSVTNQCKISECKAGSWFKDNTSNTSTTVFTNTCNPCPIGSYKTDTSTANSQCTLCAEGTTTTTIGATTSTACTACPNATGVKTDGSGWITPKFATGDNGLVLDKCSVSNCSAGQSYTQSSLAGITGFAEYTQLEYIELNGKQFIDTGLKANEKSVADIVFSASSAKGYNCMFGARASVASKAFDVFWPSSSISRATVNFANIGGTTMSDIPDLSLNTPTRFVLDDSGLTIENLLKPLKPHGDGFTTDGNVYVGDINGANCNTGESGNHKSYGKIYSFKFYQNASTTADNTLSRDMVPCKKTESNGTVQIGMCDLVSKQFFGNTYTGSDATDFIPGPEITTTTDTSKSGYTRSCPICPAGSFCTGNQDTGNECVAGSYSTEGKSVCTACDKGKYNTGTGNTTCSTNCATVEHLATNGWEQPVWATNNTMSTDVCLVARCVNGYHVCVASDNASSTVCTVQKSCNANNIILDWDENFGTAITNGSCDYDGSVSLPSAPTRSNWQFNGWVFTGSSNN